MRLTKIALILAAACLSFGLVACGDDNNNDSGSATTVPTNSDSGTTSVPTTSEDAKQACLDFAEKLENKQARDAAEKTCKNPEQAAQDAQDQAAQTGEQVQQRCLDAAKNIPDDSSRKQAEKTCNALGGE